MVIFLVLLNLINHYLSFNYYQDKVLANPSYFDLADFQSVKTEELSKPLFLDRNLSAEAILVKEFRGKTLYEKNANLKYPIASITKILSSYLALKLFSPNEILTFTSTAVNQPGEVGSFKVGEKVRVIDLIKASLIASSNDSIFLLIESYGFDKFISLLNEKLNEWGLSNTKIEDSTGLSPKNISTPYEIYQIILKIFSENPEIFFLTREEKVIINGKILWSTNILLPRYNKIIVGGKTGYTDEAGEYLALILKFPSSPYIALIILNSKDRFGDAETIIRALAKYYNYDL